MSSRNVASLGRNPLLFKDLQLLSGGMFKIYVDICSSVLGYETSEFRLIETVFIKVNIASVHSEIQRKTMRHRGFRLSLRHLCRRAVAQDPAEPSADMTVG